MTDLPRYMTQEMKDQMGIGTDAFTKLMKSGSQGAATTVWAAVSPHFEGYGGVYLADVGEAEADGAEARIGAARYAAFAYSPKKEAELWTLSNRLVGIDEDAGKAVL